MAKKNKQSYYDEWDEFDYDDYDHDRKMLERRRQKKNKNSWKEKSFDDLD